MGSGAGSSSIAGLRSIVRELGKEIGVQEVVISGAKRTTGDNMGHIPRDIIIRVK